MNNYVHILWCQGDLDIPCLLTIKSVLNFKHDLIIWTYDYNSLLKYPEYFGYIRDARDILDLDSLPEVENPYIDRNYYTIVSDFFRYKVIYNYGGWWLDSDVVLLARLNYEYEFGYRRIKTWPYPSVFYCEESNKPYILHCYNTMVVKWNKSMALMLEKKPELKRFYLPEEWFGVDQNSNYFRNTDIQLPTVGIHLCRGWANYKGYLNRKIGIYGKLREKYAV